MKTLYISDMDGTLLNDSGKVPRRSVEIINGLIKEGMLFTVAT
ncbi:MAG: HAD hydrolase family protein, partial [Candidatus Fimenecus sp.]|nr:HAD hydrolase family protein [Candidatus Fimenecus sp.]